MQLIDLLRHDLLTQFALVFVMALIAFAFLWGFEVGKKVGWNEALKEGERIVKSQNNEGNEAINILKELLAINKSGLEFMRQNAGIVGEDLHTITEKMTVMVNDASRLAFEELKKMMAAQSKPKPKKRSRKS